MIDFLARYLRDKTAAALEGGALDRPVPAFTIPQLSSSATVQRHAGRLVAHKLAGRALSDAARRAKVEQLLVHCVRRLVRAGVLLERRRGGFQVVCAALVAAYIAVLVRHTPERRGAEVRAFSAADMRERVCAAERRLARVPGATFDAALALLARAGVVHRRAGGAWGAGREPGEP